MKLKTKIHIASACLVLIVVIGMMSSLYISEKKALWNEIHQEQKDDLAKLARVYDEARLEENYLIILNYVNELVTSPKVEFAGFVNRDGYGWINPGPKRDLIFADVNKQSIQSILESGKFMKKEIQTDKGVAVIEMTRPVFSTGYVRLAYSKEEVINIVDNRLAKSIRKLTVVGIIAILFGLILAQFLSRALSQPIINLMNASLAIAKGDKGITIPEAGRDELGQLTRTFNHMSKELVKLDELKDEFMSHVTHELRSPLTSIIATVELMDEMPVANSGNAKLRRSIDRLKYGSERLNRLVDNILDLTRMEAGKMQFDILPVNMGTIASEMADFFEPRAMEKNLTIHADVPRQLPLAMADSEKIRQVLSNLIHNAIKFTNEGGITVWVKPVGDKIRVGVRDTGVGIPKEKLSTVFSKFETLKDTRDRVNKPVPGSGLGLNIVMNSIQNQNGKIWVESEVDQGTTFIFELPIAKDMPKAPTKKVEEKKKEDPTKTLDSDGNPKRQLVMMNKTEEAMG